MTPPSTLITPTLAASIVRDLIRGFTTIIHGRSEGRRFIFEGLVLENYKLIHDIHVEFHKLLLPINRELIEIENSIDLSIDFAWVAVERLEAIIQNLDEVRYHGQPDRQELYAHCQTVASSGILPQGRGRMLTDDDRREVREFMEEVCKYFECRGRYQHDFGATIDGMASTIDAWKGGNLPFTATDVRSRRAALYATRCQMADDWQRVAAMFARVRARLQFDISLESGPLPQLGPESVAGRIAA